MDCHHGNKSDTCSICVVSRISKTDMVKMIPKFSLCISCGKKNSTKRIIRLGDTVGRVCSKKCEDSIISGGPIKEPLFKFKVANEAKKQQFFAEEERKMREELKEIEKEEEELFRKGTQHLSEQEREELRREINKIMSRFLDE